MTIKNKLGVAVGVGIGLAGIYVATRKREFPETTVEMTVAVPIETAFHYIAPINLMHIFRGSFLIPAIVDTSIKKGWNKAGLVRTVYFKDGSTSQETLLTMEPPTSFTYKNEHFTAVALRSLLLRLEGEWKFTDLRTGETKIKWTYRAIPTNPVARLIVEILLMRAIRSMLTNALAIAKDDLESERLTGAFETVETVETEADQKISGRPSVVS